jgi:hypothetical protein
MGYRDPRELGYGEPRQIECLACQAVRVVFGRRKEDMGVCQSCGYSGWTYSDDLDGTAQRRIMSQRKAKEPDEAPAPASSPDPVSLVPEIVPCGWKARLSIPGSHASRG